MSESASSLATAPQPGAGDQLILCEGVVRTYRRGSNLVQALQGLDLQVARGEMVAVVGPSGSGKSTLLSILAGADVPTAGAVRVADWDLTTLSAAERVGYRRSVVGVVQQQSSRNLIPYLTAIENATVPLSLSAYPRRKRAARAADLLDRFGVGSCARRLPGELSGGEQQRVAIAVALANQPRLLLADEPTGELDTATAHDILQTLRAASAEDGVTVVVGTHDPAISGLVGRTVAIRSGRLSAVGLRHAQRLPGEELWSLALEHAATDRCGHLSAPREALELARRVRLTLQASGHHLRLDDR